MEIIYSKLAGEIFVALPDVIQKRIAKKMRWFAEQEKPLSFAVHITGSDMYRFRVGDQRIIFKPKDNKIFVVTIRSRDKAYKDL
jgi:mRNA-degrading endonuclease RelE of RelBE toxin-antitoxin system